MRICFIGSISIIWFSSVTCYSNIKIILVFFKVEHFLFYPSITDFFCDSSDNYINYLTDSLVCENGKKSKDKCPEFLLNGI